MRATKKSVTKARRSFTDSKVQFVRLQNPVAEHFSAFIMGNALKWECLAHDSLIEHAPDAARGLEPYSGLAEVHASDYKDPVATAKWREFRGLVKRHCPDQFMVKQGSHAGKTLAICGAGPSLTESAAEYCAKADYVWGCNSALTWLYEHGHSVTHGFTVDQTPAMINEWEKLPPVEYLLASSVHPFLTEHIQRAGHPVRFFHNYVGVQGGDMEWPAENGAEPMRMMREDWMYAVLFLSSVRAGSGLNATTRAIDVAGFMGFDKIWVLGADCAMKTKRPAPEGAMMGSAEHDNWLKNDLIMHADGGNAIASGASPMVMTGEIDGREWNTKVDMMISAIWLTKMARRLPQVELIGDTLPNALKDKDDAFLDRLPKLIGIDGEPVAVP